MAGKIDCYECQACNKKFKNSSGSSAGRGSAICHIATDHGRLLEALLNEDKDMSKEIEFLAQHDKGFHDSYKAYLSDKKKLFGLDDDKIIKSKESLIWKIQEKTKDEKKKELPSQNVGKKLVKSPMKTGNKENLDTNVKSHNMARTKASQKEK